MHDLTEEEILDWWDWSNEGDAWRIQMKEDGFAALTPDMQTLSDGDRRVLLICEEFWVPVQEGWVASPLWDEGTPSRVGSKILKGIRL